MIRTRDLLLFLICLVFLIVALTYEWSGSSSGGGADDALPFVTSEPVLEQGAILEEVVIDRAAHRVSLRERVLAYMQTMNPLPPEPTVPPEPSPEDIVAVTTNEVLYCPSYRGYVSTWQASRLYVVEREGARLVTSLPPTATPDLEQAEEVVAVLPVRSIPALPVAGNCLPTDVVGFSLGGVPLRVTDFASYQVITDVNIVGYALDGFPIYGVTSRTDLDTCGGAVVGGEYRYYLQAERAGLINCFAGAPAQL